MFVIGKLHLFLLSLENFHKNNQVRIKIKTMARLSGHGYIIYFDEKIRMLMQERYHYSIYG